MTKSDVDTTNMNPSKGKRAPTKKPAKTISTIIPPPTVAPVVQPKQPSILEPFVHIQSEELSKTFFTGLTNEEVSDIRKLLASQVASSSSADSEDGEDGESGDDLEDVDLFKVETENFLGDAVKEVVFPKFLKNTQRVEEKSNLYMALHGDPKVYAQLLKLVASDQPLKPLVIKLYEPNEEETKLEIAVTYEFPTPTLLAIDFGNLSHSREKPREIRIEFNFNHFKVDDVDFYC